MEVLPIPASRCVQLLRYAKVARLVIEEIVQVTRYDHVEVQEKYVAADAFQVFLPDAKLAPWQLGYRSRCLRMQFSLRQHDMRQGEGFHARHKAGGVVGVADKPRRPARMPLHHGVKPVDIVRPIARAPFHANDCLRHILPLPPSRFANFRSPAPLIALLHESVTMSCLLRGRCAKVSCAAVQAAIETPHEQRPLQTGNRAIHESLGSS